jgi:DNA modification methylase
MNLKTVTLANLTPHPDNPNTHPAKQINALAESLDEFTQVKNVVVWNDRIIAGHALVTAALKSGRLTLEAVDVSHWPEDKATAFMLADVRLPDMAIVDDEALVEALRAIDEPLEIPGFDEDFLKGLPGFGEDEPPGPSEPPIDKAEELQEKWSTELGQLWALGDHRLAVGDCTDPAVVEGVMGGEKAFLCLTDPPYGININSNAKAIGVATDKSRKATGKSWDKSPPEKNAFDLIFAISDEQVIFGANYFWEYFYSSGCYIVWDKRGNLPHVPFADTEFAWTSFIDKPSKRYVIINHGFIRDEKEERFHPTQKPVKLFFEIINDFTQNDELIYDPFLGSGTTLIACENLNRRCRGIEIDPGYAAVTLQRFLDHTGIQPELI